MVCHKPDDYEKGITLYNILSDSDFTKVQNAGFHICVNDLFILLPIIKEAFEKVEETKALLVRIRYGK
jgi:hypothetical protein